MTTITAAQQRAIDEWLRRLGSTANDPHYAMDVFGHSNRETALRRSIGKLLDAGVFVETWNHKWQLVPAYQVPMRDEDEPRYEAGWVLAMAPGPDLDEDDGLPF